MPGKWRTHAIRFEHSAERRRLAGKQAEATSRRANAGGRRQTSPPAPGYTPEKVGRGHDR